MKEKAPLIKPYLFIKRNRFKRKKRLYTKALQVMIDKTTAIYLAVLLSYFLISLFVVGDFSDNYNAFFLVVEKGISQYGYLVLLSLPMIGMVKAFTDPGVVYSTGESYLSFLPYKRKKVWWLIVGEKWIKQTTLYLAIGLLIILLTPISFVVITRFVLILLLIQILITIPQWILYQKHFLVKLILFLPVLALNIGMSQLESFMIYLVMFTVFIILNIALYSLIFNKINWDKIIESGDFTVWNMKLISSASGVRLKRKKNYRLFANRKSQKKPFIYNAHGIYQKIWKLYLWKNITPILQLISAIVVLLSFFMFLKPLLFQIAIAFSIYAYTSSVAQFFGGRFTSDIVEVLPWDLSEYKKSYFKWVNFGAIIIFIPIIVSLFRTMTIWFPLELFFYISVYYFIYEFKINKMKSLIAKESISFVTTEILGYLLLIGIIFNAGYPLLSFASIVIWLVILKGKNDKLKIRS